MSHLSPYVHICPVIIIITTEVAPAHKPQAKGVYTPYALFHFRLSGFGVKTRDAALLLNIADAIPIMTSPKLDSSFDIDKVEM